MHTSRELSGIKDEQSMNDVCVNVVENYGLGNHSVWLGGSIMASTQEFKDICYTKAQYEENGPQIARNSIAFKAKF